MSSAHSEIDEPKPTSAVPKPDKSIPFAFAATVPPKQMKRFFPVLNLVERCPGPAKKIRKAEEDIETQPYKEFPDTSSMRSTLAQTGATTESTRSQNEKKHSNAKNIQPSSEVRKPEEELETQLYPEFTDLDSHRIELLSSSSQQAFEPEHEPESKLDYEPESQLHYDPESQMQ